MLWAGVVVGVGAQAKPQVILVAVGLMLGLAIFGPRVLLRSWWTAGGVLAAALLAAPYLAWQAAHGWPQLTVAGNIGGSAEGGRLGFIPFQLIVVSPVLVPVWVAGLVAPFRRVQQRPQRFLSVCFLFLAVVYLLGNGKAYCLASLYPALLGTGGVAVDGWLADSRRRLVALSVAIAASAAVGAVVALPLLPARSLDGSLPKAVNPDLAEMVGWPEYVDAVRAAWLTIPAADRAHAVIFTENYGEAGAIDLLGRPAGLPRAFSGHNGYSEWGRPRDDQTIVLATGFHPAEAAHWFVGCSQVGRVENSAGVENQEQAGPLLVCDGLRRNWAAAWPMLTHYN
jgi:hypothetical protein